MWQERDRVRMEGGRIAWECFFLDALCIVFCVVGRWFFAPGSMTFPIFSFFFI